MSGGDSLLLAWECREEEDDATLGTYSPGRWHRFVGRHSGTLENSELEIEPWGVASTEMPPPQGTFLECSSNFVMRPRRQE